ncbi:TatD family hydrolase [Rhizomicrobium electricum]|jgi:TatD DNase family protein|uniref:TatD family hydrolase n=1 Tax=Rhizomicrobium electricum TaxID=480070 RepID=A0ABN1F0B9_9PROT|nr:TatD family hydrolase [Rhizomicrobium electricum]NIJ50180.1 TatD DNase family protein [Rhizomicrobium electricum]
MLVDSHCHLEYDSYAAEGDAPIERARAAGVGACVTIGTKLSTFPKTLAVAERYDNVWCSVGSHPDAADEESFTDASQLIAHAQHPKVIGIGETGLDYHYETPSQAAQATNFLVHIDAAQETRLPLIVHTRDAEDDTIAMLEEKMKRAPFTGVLHCFTGTAKLAEAGLRLGLYISASGIITFKNAEPLRDVFREVPMDRLLVETDSPYLAPIPYRGKRNEPSFVTHTAAMLAELKGVSPDEIALRTTDNFFRLFLKAVLT